MNEKMENKSNNNQQEQQNEQMPGNGPVEGRLYDSRNPQFQQLDGKDDISHVDRQEGEMNNGTTAVPGEEDHSEGR